MKNPRKSESSPISKSINPKNTGISTTFPEESRRHISDLSIIIENENNHYGDLITEKYTQTSLLSSDRDRDKHLRSDKYSSPSQNNKSSYSLGQNSSKLMLNNLNSPRINSQGQKNIGVILKEINDLKEAKKNSLNLPNTHPTNLLRREFNNKITQRLAELLGLIMDDPNPLIDDMKKNLKIILKDIDKLQGKVIDGHLKTKLLFQFLKEFMNIQEDNDNQLKIPLPSIHSHFFFLDLFSHEI